MREQQEALVYLQVLLYTCVLLKAVKPYLVNPLRYAAHQGRQRVSRCKLKVHRVSVNALLKTATKNHCELDLNAIVLVSEKTALKLGFKNGWWQRVIFCHDNNHNEKHIQDSCLFSGGGRWIQVVFCPKVEHKLCLVSPVLYHNIQDNDSGCTGSEISVHFIDCCTEVPSDAVKKVLALWNELQGFTISPTAPPCLPNLATEIHIKVIESAQYRYGVELEALLIDYFRIPKIASLGDTLVLSIPSHLAHEFTPSNAIVPPKNIYIKVIRVMGRRGETDRCVRVAVGSTTLYLAGSTQSPFPSYTENFSYGEIDVPPLLKDVYAKLRKVMQVVLQGDEGRTTYLNDSKIRESTPSTPKTARKIERAITTPTQGSKGNHIKGITVLFLSAPGQGSEQVIRLAASSVGLSTVWVNCWQVKGDTSATTEAKLHQALVRAASLGPCVTVLQDVHCLSKDRDGEEDIRVAAALRQETDRLCRENPSIVLVATAPNREALSDDLWSVWSYQECIEVADLNQRCDMLKWLVPMSLSDHQYLTLAQRTAGYVMGDFLALVNNAKRQSLMREAAEKREQCELESIDHQASIPHLQYSDLLQALGELQASRSEALGAPHIPQVQWGEVGGLEGAKRQIINTIQLPLSFPSLVATKLRHSGVLLYGPPGTGKTLLAKAVATECGLNFLSVKGPELLNMYVGQSEENVRQVFQRAQSAAPCVVFFDELDSLAPNRGHTGDSGGVMDRIVSALLSELDGVADAADVFVLAATNRPDLLDPALLRPGRFEKLVFVGVCEDHKEQVKILKAVTSKIPLSPLVSLERVASRLPLSLTGADMYALVTDALYTALHRCIKDLHAGLLQEEEVEVMVTEEDFEVVAKTLIPSVSSRELAHYHSLSTTRR